MPPVDDGPARKGSQSAVRLSGLLAVIRARLCADARGAHARLPGASAGQRTCA